MNFKYIEIKNWYKTEAGKINAETIINTISRNFNPHYGKYIIYIGLKSIIESIKVNYNNPNSFYISLYGNSDFYANIKNLPLEELSIDYVVLIHSLDFEEDPYNAFKEVNRVLKEDGEIIVCGFNKSSALGIYNYLPIKTIFKKKNFLSIRLLLSWISLFSLKIKKIYKVNKIPPISNSNLIKYLFFLNKGIFYKINFFGNNYILFLKKETYSCIVSKNWHKPNNFLLRKVSKKYIQNTYEQ